MLTDYTLPPLAGGKPKHAVIILHGLGDSGTGLLDLGQSLRPVLTDTEFLSPDAPFPCDMAPFGFQWFSMQDRSPEAILAGVEKAAPLLNEYINHVLTSRNLPPANLALMGFSQGTMMALHVAPRREPPPLAGVIGYSGALIGGETLQGQRKSNPPFLLLHGTHDEVVPFAALQMAVTGLQNANLNVTSFARPGLGHSIDEAGLNEGLLFLRRVFT